MATKTKSKTEEVGIQLASEYISLAGEKPTLWEFIDSKFNIAKKKIDFAGAEFKYLSVFYREVHAYYITDEISGASPTLKQTDYPKNVDASKNLWKLTKYIDKLYSVISKTRKFKSEPSPLTSHPLTQPDKDLLAPRQTQQLENVQELADKREVLRKQLSELFQQLEQPLDEFLEVDRQLVQQKSEVVQDLPEFVGGLNEVMGYIQKYLSAIRATGHFSQADFKNNGYEKMVRALHNYCSKEDEIAADKIPAASSIQDNLPPVVPENVVSFVGSKDNTQKSSARRKRAKS